MSRYSAVGAALVAVLALTATAEAARNTPDPDPGTSGAAVYGKTPLDIDGAGAISYWRGDGVLEVRIALRDDIRVESVRLRCLSGGRDGPVVAVLGGLADAGRAADGTLYRNAILRGEDVIATDGTSDACPYVIETLDDLAAAIEFGDIQMDLQVTR